MSWLFGHFGAMGLKLLKFACTAGTISFIVLAMSETAAPAVVQAAILLIVALILVPAVQFRPQIFDFLCLSAIVAMLSRDIHRGSAPLWISIPLVAIWINIHGGFFVGLVAIGVYGAAILVSDLLTGRGPARGVRILAIDAGAAASTLLTFLIPPARESWYTLIYSVRNPLTSTTILDWKPLLASLTSAPTGSLEQKYFALVLIFFAVAALSVILTPKGADAPLVAVAAVLVAMAFLAQRNIPIATIAIAPVLANHLALMLRSREGAGTSMPRRSRWVVEALIALLAIGFARYSGILSSRIDASGFPADAVEFMNSHGLKGNVLADYGWGQYVIWHGAPGTKVFIDSRFDLAYPPAVIRDFMKFDTGTPDGSHTLAAYPNDFVLIKRDWPAARLMRTQRDWRLLYSDDVAMLYAPANSAAAHLDGVPFTGVVHPAFFP